jgi:hypothetical protein
MAFIFDIAATRVKWQSVLVARGEQATAQSDYDAEYAVKPTPPQDVTSSVAWNDYTDDLNSWQSSVNMYKATLDTAKNNTAAAVTDCIGTLFTSDSAPSEWCFDQWVNLLATPVLWDSGSGYTVGNTLTATGGTTTVIVQTVDGSGHILTAYYGTIGTGYSTGTNYNLTGGSGSGAVLLYPQTPVVTQYWIGVARDAYQIVSTTVMPTQTFPNL